MKKLALHFQILIGMILGLFYGLFLSKEVGYVDWLGDLFLKGLKMVIVPLIFSSIVSGMTNIGSGKNLGRIGLKTFFYYITTSVFAIVTGLFFVNVLQPGKGVDISTSKQPEFASGGMDFREIIQNIVPQNIFDAMASNTAVLSVIFFGILMGYFITQVKKDDSELLKRFFNAFFEVMMRITSWVIQFTPIGVFALVAKSVAETEDLSSLAAGMGKYMLTVLLALLVHAVITLPFIIRLIGKYHPLKHFRNMTTPLLTAFSTSSSSATLPLTMEAVEHKGKVSNKITSFTLPLGATVNMDGTALYECVAAMFIAQAYGIEVTFVQQFLLVATALLASIGAAGIPMAGLVMMSVILTALGLPLEGIGYLLAVDRILDMCRTAVNVWSDSCGAVVIASSEGEINKDIE